MCTRYGFDFEEEIDKNESITIHLYNDLNNVAMLNVWKLNKLRNIHVRGETNNSFLILCTKYVENVAHEKSIKFSNLNVSFIDFSEDIEYQAFEKIEFDHSRFINVPNKFFSNNIVADLYSLNGTTSFSAEEISINFNILNDDNYNFSLNPSQHKEMTFNLMINSSNLTYNYDIIYNNNDINFAFEKNCIFIRIVSQETDTNIDTIHFNIFDNNTNNTIKFKKDKDFDNAIYDIHIKHQNYGKIYINSDIASLLSELIFQNISICNSESGEILLNTQLNTLDDYYNEISISGIKLVQNEFPKHNLKITGTLFIEDIYDIESQSNVNVPNLIYDFKYPQFIVNLDKFNGTSSIIIDNDLNLTSNTIVELKPITTNYSFLDRVHENDTIFSICAKKMNAKVELVSSDDQKFLFSEPQMSFIQTTTKMNDKTCENLVFSKFPEYFIYEINETFINYSKINDDPNISVIVIHNPIDFNFTKIHSKTIPYKIYYSLSSISNVTLIDSKENVELYFYNTRIIFDSQEPSFKIISLRRNSTINGNNTNLNLSKINELHLNLEFNSSTYGCRNISLSPIRNHIINFTENGLVSENGNELSFGPNVTTIYYYILDNETINFNSKKPDNINFYLVFKEQDPFYRTRINEYNNYAINFSGLNLDSFINDTNNFNIILGEKPSVTNYIPIKQNEKIYILPIDFHSIPNIYSTDSSNYFGICSYGSGKFSNNKEFVYLTNGITIKDKVKTIFTMQECSNNLDMLPIISVPFINMSSNSIFFAKTLIYNYFLFNQRELYQVENISVENGCESSIIEAIIKNQIYVGQNSKLNLYHVNLDDNIKMIINCSSNNNTLIRFIKTIYNNDLQYLSKYSHNPDNYDYNNLRFPDNSTIQVNVDKYNELPINIMEFSDKSDCLFVKKNTRINNPSYIPECIETDKLTKLIIQFQTDVKSSGNSKYIYIFIPILFVICIALFIFIFFAFRNHKKWLTSTIITDTILEPPEDL